MTIECKQSILKAVLKKVDGKMSLCFFLYFLLLAVLIEMWAKCIQKFAMKPKTVKYG